MSAIGCAIAAEFAESEATPLLEEEIFGTRDPDRIAARVDRFCSRHLGSPIASYEFFATSVMSVHGVRLADGRRVVVKVARPSLDGSVLSAVQVIQRHLSCRRFPCPRPLLGPTPLEAGVGVVEELLERGTRADAHDAGIRATMAQALARIVALCRGFRTLEGLPPSPLASPAASQLWPEPHDRRFDFPATAGGAEWIDELSAEARARLSAGRGEIVLAHTDWRAEHVRFDGAQIVAAYDWQSLAVGREPALVGLAAHAFTADWALPQAHRLPALEEARGFVSDYEAARGA